MNWLSLGTALGFLGIAAVWIEQALQLPFPSFARASRVGPAHFPLIVASLLALLSVIWAIQELAKPDPEREVDVPILRVVPWYLAFGVYAVLVPVLGFVLASIGFIFGTVMVKSKERLQVRLGKALLASILITGLEWAVFKAWLGVPLPSGLLGG